MSSDARKTAHVHVSGVGGVGMNAIAQLLRADGLRVTGSDRFIDQGTRLPVFEALEGLGVELVPQDGNILTTDTAALVLSTAVEADNPERRRAKALGVRERHRAEVLAEFCARGRVAAIAGTSGKTTCTGWLGWVLFACGLDPNVVNGGGVLNWKTSRNPGNVRRSADTGWWVVEVDESDRSLLRFAPEVALITSMTADHFPLAETWQLFRDFAAQVSRTIVCGPGVREQLAGDPRIRATLVDAPAPMASPLPGEHNALNAASVWQTAVACGGDPEAARSELASFRGIERRLEKHGPAASGLLVYDDYAHNPEKIAAAIRAVQPVGGRQAVLWRPHGFGPLRQNFDALADAFAEALREQDEAWILPVFYAGGTADKSIDGAQLAEAILARGRQARFVADYAEAENHAKNLGRGDVLLVMGARDPELPAFAARMGR